ncbi:VOC family protein [Vibrio genomosp. F6]|uniref:VOC family protein n=1 Tax=Vibrio genomosp. F6 TaxID=723172 RepID=UPI0010BDA7C2|nr:VOC family protein [Vibrio genomosp. F6]TKF14856.1 VOC family protein [Vibrio genomosp. F6]
MRKLSIITLGVSNIEASAQFYEAVLGLERTDYQSDEIVFMDVDGPVLALFPKPELAKDVGVEPKGSGFAGITFARNVNSSREVINLLEKADENGGKVVKQGQPVFWGGFSGYFADLDGYLWEIAVGSNSYIAEIEQRT